MNQDCLKCNPSESKIKKACYCNLKTRELTDEEKTKIREAVANNPNIPEENKVSFLKVLETAKDIVRS